MRVCVCVLGDGGGRGGGVTSWQFLAARDEGRGGGGGRGVVGAPIHESL